jgi:hypothetical protein
MLDRSEPKTLRMIVPGRLQGHDLYLYICSCVWWDCMTVVCRMRRCSIAVGKSEVYIPDAP